MLSVTLLPVIKDKAGKVGSLDNYRPIALASVVSKVLERIILGVYLDNQFGFKAHHSTDLCIYARGLHGLKTEARTRPVPEIVWPNPTRPEQHG